MQVSLRQAPPAPPPGLPAACTWRFRSCRRGMDYTRKRTDCPWIPNRKGRDACEPRVHGRAQESKRQGSGGAPNSRGPGRGALQPARLPRGAQAGSRGEQAGPPEACESPPSAPAAGAGREGAGGGRGCAHTRAWIPGAQSAQPGLPVRFRRSPARRAGFISPHLSAGDRQPRTGARTGILAGGALIPAPKTLVTDLAHLYPFPLIAC